RGCVARLDVSGRVGARPPPRCAPAGTARHRTATAHVSNRITVPISLPLVGHGVAPRPSIRSELLGLLPEGGGFCSLFGATFRSEIHRRRWRECARRKHRRLIAE